ncbi:hypothetical protein BG004_005501 [Podila humilis]|nr:hypothetical protein BG004_005501 [Podila humilis]
MTPSAKASRPLLPQFSSSTSSIPSINPTQSSSSPYTHHYHHHHQPMKRSRVSLVRTVMLACITFAAMAIVHLYFSSTLKHEREEERERQLQHQFDAYISASNSAAAIQKSSTLSHTMTSVFPSSSFTAHAAMTTTTTTTTTTTAITIHPTTITQLMNNKNDQQQPPPHAAKDATIKPPTRPAKTQDEFRIVKDTGLSTTLQYKNGTTFKIFKPAFYRNAKKAKKELGSFMETLATRSWMQPPRSFSSSSSSTFTTEMSPYEEGEDEDEEEEEEEGEEIQPTNRFLAYLPMGGGNNQFSTLQRAALLAKDLNRTLLLPPISPSSHIKSKIPVLEWHDLKQTPSNPPRQLQSQWSQFSEEFPCVPNGGIGVNDTNLYDHFRQEFLLSFKSTVPQGGVDTTNGTSTEYDYARDVLLRDNNNDNNNNNNNEDDGMWRCLSAPYFLVGPEVNDRAWAEVGAHLRFNNHIEDMVDDILDKLLGTSTTPSKQQPAAPSEGQEGQYDDTPSLIERRARRRRRHPEFIIVHLRRGDIVNKCKPGVPETECIVQIEQIAEKIDEIEKKRRIRALSASASASAASSMSDDDDDDGTSTVLKKKKKAAAIQDQENKKKEHVVLKRLPVLVTTNEKRPSELAKLETLGWIMLDHGDKILDATTATGEDEEEDDDKEMEKSSSKTIKLGTFSSLGPFWPPMLDAALLTRGNYFIGMKKSRMSQLAAQRGAAWHGHKTLLM